MSVAVYGERPSNAECTFIGKFAPANNKAEYSGIFSRYYARLAADRLWLADDICISLTAIQSTEIIRRGILIPRYALRIVFVNSVTDALDSVCLCDIGFLGFYHRRRLEQLENALREVLPENQRADCATGDTAEFVPRRETLFHWFCQSMRYVFASRRTLERHLCINWIQNLGVDEELSGMSLEDMHGLIARLLKEEHGDSIPTDIPAQVAKNALAYRVCAFWTLFWALVLPLAILAVWLLPRLPKQWDVATIIGTIVVVLCGYSFLATALSLFSALLWRPFLWVANRGLGINIQALPQRRH
jgi:hypothetical protein